MSQELDYTSGIKNIIQRQHDKGLAKYGETLEENTSLSRKQRIEHIEEELVDGLQYCEHLKAVIGKELSANDYQRMAERTSNMFESDAPVMVTLQSWGVDISKVPKDKLMLLNGVLGLNGEAGEVIDIVKKCLFQGHAVNESTTAHLKEELGDVAWYLASCCSALDISLEEVLKGNIDKLIKRYPEGFDKARSINRQESGHRDLMDLYDESYVNSGCFLQHELIGTGDCESAKPYGKPYDNANFNAEQHAIDSGNIINDSLKSEFLARRITKE